MTRDELKTRYCLDAKKRFVYTLSLLGEGGVIASKRVSLENTPRELTESELRDLIRKVSASEWWFGSFGARGGNSYTFYSKGYYDLPGVMKSGVHKVLKTPWDKKIKTDWEKKHGKIEKVK